VLGHRVALGTVAATFLLILAGGLVTNTGSALAVPDWPTTYGHNMFVYPWSAMVGGIFFEHSHRLLGSLVGLLTVVLATTLGLTEPRRWVRALGGVAVLLVVLQGVLGGLRVVLVKDAIAIFHGGAAQAFFALTVILALVTSREWLEHRPAPVSGRLVGLAAAAAALLYAQIVFGALLTHAGLIDLHLIGAAAVFAFVPIVTARARRTGQRLLARPAEILLVLLFVQLALGVGAYLARFSSMAIPGGQSMVLALPVAHRLVAALILGSAVALLAGLVRTGRARPLAAAVSPVRLRPATVETNA
jgi:cytochrome c oxidase assembly protein subunit 15